VGAGAFGTALAEVIAARGGPVILHSDDVEIVRDLRERRRNERRLPGVTLPPGVEPTGDYADLFGPARFVILAVSSARVGRTIRELAPHLTPSHIVVHAIAGLVGGAERVSEVLLRDTSCQRVGAMAGPALARDLVERRPCAVVVASAYEEVLKLARSALGAPPALRVYGSPDLVGVELAAILSGAMTIALGIADGLDVGVGPRAFLVTRAVAEAGRVAAAAGGKLVTSGGLAGLGNLLARSSSASSERSDDYQYGRSLARPDRPRPPTEGSRGIAAGLRLARAAGTRTPILETLDAIVNDGLTPAEAVAKLLEYPSDLE
jgi:glycerol-3-phosphate dehydrogenase (NAD(P)+)